MDPIENIHVEDDSVSDTDTMQSVLAQPQKPEAPTEGQEAIDTLFKNIHWAQSLKGVLTMAECEVIIKSKDKLVNFFEAGNKEFTTKDVEEASLIIVKACEKQNSTGVYNMEGSVMLLNKLRILEKELEKRKSPVEKMSELRQRKTAQVEKGQQNKQPRGRGKGPKQV